MRRYAVAIVLTAWTISLAAGCQWVTVWLVLLAFAVVIQAAEHVNDYWRSP